MCFDMKLKIVRFLVLCGILFVVPASFTYAEAAQNQVDSSAVEEPENDAQGIVSEDTLIPIFNCEEDFGVRKALAMLGSMCNKNIVPSPSVDGSLAFRRLTNVTFEEAMNAILGDNFKYEEDGNLVDDEDGPLRIVFLNEDGNVTDSYRWAKQVVNLTITEVPLSSLAQEADSAMISSESLVEMQFCGQSKLFTYTMVRRF